MSFISKYVNIPVFLMSFAFGVFAVYVTLPDTKRIMVYPSPDNIDIIQYKDKAHNCFRFQETSVSCPASTPGGKGNTIAKVPMQA